MHIVHALFFCFVLVVGPFIDDSSEERTQHISVSKTTLNNMEI